MPLECYLFRTCTAKMAQHGFAKELSIPVKNGELDSSAFTEMLAQIIRMKDSQLIGLNSIITFKMLRCRCIHIKDLHVLHIFSL